MRFLKKEHGYSIAEQEEMLPFERDIHLQLIQSEKLIEQNKPAQGWVKYAEDIGITKKTKYTNKFQIIEEKPVPGTKPTKPMN